ncbi:MAG: M23 family metallopeptidase [Prolixibacteraceae bacterium]|nr:M23 family metallopeptidase [Prolixibacteraceae bacterium]
MKRLIFLIFLVLVAMQLDAQSFKPLKISYIEVADGLFDFYADNQNSFPLQVEIKFTELSNMDADCDLPYTGTVRSGKHKIFTMRRVIIDIPGGFDYTSTSRIGAYPVKPDEDAVYKLPVKAGKTTKAIGFDLANSRTPEKVMWGFEMEEGDTVYAARGGVVAMLTEPRWRDSLRVGDNTITVLHSDDTFGKYELLADSSVMVAVGDTLNTGDMLGRVGVTRFTRVPHIRFSVYYVNMPIDSINANKTRDIHAYVNPYFGSKGKKRTLEDGKEYTNGK